MTEDCEIYKGKTAYHALTTLEVAKRINENSKNKHYVKIPD